MVCASVDLMMCWKAKWRMMCMQEKGGSTDLPKYDSRCKRQLLWITASHRYRSTEMKKMRKGGSWLKLDIKRRPGSPGTSRQEMASKTKRSGLDWIVSPCCKKKKDKRKLSAGRWLFLLSFLFGSRNILLVSGYLQVIERLAWSRRKSVGVWETRKMNYHR